MLYPINSHENSNNLSFKKHIRRLASSNPEAIATLNYQMLERINTLKSAYLEIINRVKSNSILASQMATGINNIRIDDSIITVLGDNNTTIKLSMLEVGISKLFRIKFLENKELRNMITVDNYKLVERVNKNDIVYLKKNSINESEIASCIENLYKTLDEPFLELKKYLRSNNFTKVEIPKEKSIKFKPALEKIEIIPGVTADMLPISRTTNQEEKPLFSYAALIAKTEPQKKSISETRTEEIEIISENDVATSPKRRGRTPKTSKEIDTPAKRRGRPPKASTLAEEKTEQKVPTPKRRGRPAKIINNISEGSVENIVSIPKRRGRPPKANKMVLLEVKPKKTRKRIDNSTAGQLPRTLTEKIKQAEFLYQEINNLWKDFSHTKLVRLKNLFNVGTRRKHGLYFDEPNGDKLSIIKLERKDFKDSNLLKINFESSNKSLNVFAVIDNAKKLVSNVSGKNNQAFYSKLRYQTQNEVNNTVYQGNLQVTIDKIIHKLSELKKSLANEEWKLKQNRKLKSTPKAISTSKKQETTTPENIVKTKLESVRVKPESKPAFRFEKHIITQIESLWQDLQATTEQLNSSKKSKKIKAKLSISKSYLGGFKIKDKDSSISIDKLTNVHGRQYRIIEKKDKTIENAFIITEDGLVVKNIVNGNLPATKKLKFVTEDDDTDKILRGVVKTYNKLKNFSQKLKKEVEENTNNAPFNIDSSINLLQEEKETMDAEQVKKVMNDAIEDLDNTIVEIKKDFGIIYKFNEVVNKIKQNFSEFISKLSNNK